jgi:transposase
MQAYSIEFRREVLADCDAGMGTMAVAIKHRVSDSWVRRLKQRRRESGEIAARPPKKKTPPKWHAYADRLRALVQQRPDITLRELRETLAVEVSLQTLSVALRSLRYSFKKKSCGPRSKIGQTSRRGGPYGESNKRDSTRNGLFSSTKRG